MSESGPWRWRFLQHDEWREEIAFRFSVSQLFQRSHPALTPPPALNPAPPLPFNHKAVVDRVLAPGGYSIVASEVSLSQRTGGSLSLFTLYR